MNIRALLACLALAAPVLASDPGVVVVGDGEQKATISLEGSRLVVTTTDGADTSVQEVDLEAISLLVGDALDDVVVEMGAAFDQLEGLNLEVHVDGQDRIVVASGDEKTVIDVQAIVATAMEAASTALAGLEDISQESGAWTDADEEQLRAEIERLRDEIATLRHEIDDQSR